MNILKEISETDLPAIWDNRHYQISNPLCPRVAYMRSRWFDEYKAEVVSIKTQDVSYILESCLRA